MKKLLIIDDDESIRFSIKEIFEFEGFEVDEARDGNIGIKMTNEKLYDFVICDIEMPNINGYQVIKKLKNNPKYLTVPFIFLSGLNKPTDLVKGLKMGADDYLTKPFDYTEIINVVNNKLAKKEKIDKLVKQKAEEIKVNLSYSIPHELLTPLNSIIGPMSMIVEGGIDFEEDELKELYNIVFLSSKRLKNTIEKFILHNELNEFNKNDLSIEEIDIKESISNVYKELVSNTYREFDFDIEVENIKIKTSKRFFNALVNEIISNCIKFSNPGQRIYVNSDINNGNIILSFKDEGIGLSEEDIKKIDSFVQFNRKSNEQQGTGLGLSIIKMICNILDYNLTISSEIEKFTVVSIKIPFN